MFNIMKTKTQLILLTLFILSTPCLKAQSIANIIPCNDYKAITYNGKTIAQINATNADPQSVQQLWGSYSSIDEREDARSRSFHYENNKVHFDTELGHVGRIDILNNQWPVVIQSKTVRVGDSVSSLQQAFGSNLIVAQSQYSPRTFISFNCNGNEADGIHLDIDSNTNTITSITYWVNP